MNYEQLLKRTSQHKRDDIFRIEVIDRNKNLEEIIEVIAFAYVAQKYKQSYLEGHPIPDDLTDELFETKATIRDRIQEYD